MVSRSRLEEGLQGLVEMIPNAKMPGTVGVDIFERALVAMSDPVFDRAIAAWARRGSKFMPMPGELEEVINGSPTEKGQVLWAHVEKAMRELGRYRSLSFHPAANAAIRFLGGWSKVCESNEEELTFRRAEFLRVVATHLKHGVGEAGEYHMGLEEADHVRRQIEWGGEIALVGPGAVSAKTVGRVQLGAGKIDAAVAAIVEKRSIT